jgi:hypothetical protein
MSSVIGSPRVRLISQPNPTGDSPVTTAKPPARYSAMETRGRATSPSSSYTSTYDTTLLLIDNRRQAGREKPRYFGEVLVTIEPRGAKLDDKPRPLLTLAYGQAFGVGVGCRCLDCRAGRATATAPALAAQGPRRRIWLLKGHREGR